MTSARHEADAEHVHPTQVSGVFVRVLLEVVDRLGVPPDKLLRGNGLTMAQLEQPQLRIALSKLGELGLRAVELTRRPDLGLVMPERSSETSYDLFAPLIRHAPTLRDGLRTCLQFHPLLADHVHLTLIERAGLAQLRADLPRLGNAFDAVFSEFVIAGFFGALRSCLGNTARAQAIYFEHAMPAHHGAYSRLFGCAVHFRKPMTALEFSAELLDRPLLLRNAELYAVLYTHAERQLDRLAQPPSHAERLKQALLARSPVRIPTIKAAARDFGLSARSLQRRLAEEGTSYRDVADAVLEVTAKRMVRSRDRSLQEIAHELGFSNPTAFHRAFKRWTKLTAQEYREQRVTDTEP